MTDATEYLYTPDADELRPVLMGRRIVKAEMSNTKPPSKYWDGGPTGTLTLDDGTVLHVWGNDGGCCSAGCYPLEHVAKCDNIITDVEVHADPDGDDYSTKCPECGSYYCRHDAADRPEGVYRIFVFHGDQRINVAEFSGTDGNGYYGTGFHVRVSPAEVSS